MKKQLSFLKGLALAAVVTFGFAQCENATTEPVNPQDPNNPSTAKQGQTTFKMTDAPIDDASVEGVFVTVTEIKVDGETYEGFSGKQTINLMNYQEGETTILGTGELNAQTYSEITLVLDYEMDAMGNTPGCYVATVDGMKHDLSAQGETTGEIVINKSYEVQEDVEQSYVIDFDVRKAITYENNASTMTDYQFVTTAELNNSLRFVKEEETGMVDGNMQDNPAINSGDKIVVFAYTKGTYNQETETNGQGESNVMFSNAVTSTIVNDNGNYTLAFMEEGDYELHFIAYEDSDNDGRMEAKGELSLNLLANIGLDLNSISVDANSSVSLDVLITGIINF